MRCILLAAVVLLLATVAFGTDTPTATATNTPTSTPTFTSTPTPTPGLGRLLNAASTNMTARYESDGLGLKTVQFQNTVGSVTANVNCAIRKGGPMTQLYTTNLTTGAAGGGELHVFEHHCEVIELEAAACTPTPGCSLSGWVDVDKRRKQ